MQHFGTFDYVIAGGGSAGCVLANRLSADPTKRVLLLERGGQDNWIWFHIPAGYLFAIGNPRADWMFSTQAEDGLNKRVLAYPRGKVLGGSSAINAMIYMRGQAADYDSWKQQGLSGWGWDDVLPYFLKHEDHVDGTNPFHAQGGEWRVEHPRIRWKILDLIREAAATAGIAPIDDFNRGDNEGSSYFQVNQKNGRRWSAARGFLKPVAKRPNLHVQTGVHVEQVELTEGRATAILFSRGSEHFRAEAAGEAILSAGAIGSPMILEASGIGNAEVLKSMQKDCAHHSPGVGENLQDHLQIRPVYKVSGIPTLNSRYANIFRRGMMGVEYLIRRTGPLTMAPSQLGAFARSSDAFETANLEFHFQPLSLDKWGDGLHPFDAFTASVCNLRPTSRGSVHLSSDGEPHIRPRYLSTETDRLVAIDSLRLARKIVAQPALAPYQPQEHLPGSEILDDHGLLEAAGNLGTTIFHPVGTAKMGSKSDPTAVVDDRLRVRGIRGLRVIDASVMPTITSGNTNSPTIMIAEKGADMVIADGK